jgi:hypothetical protein
MVFSRRGLVACILGLAVGASAADGPAFLRYALTGERDGDYYGKALAAMGDLDGDGVPDFALGSIEYRVADGENGKVLLVSGSTGETIRTLRSGEQLRHFGQTVANAGDVDGDGVNDLLAGGPGRVEQRSGATGELLGIVRDRNYNTTGVGLASIGDVNMDGVPDFAVGNWRPQVDSQTSRLHVHSGASPAEVLWSRVGEHPGDRFGGALAPAGDVNADGVPDLAAGAPYTPEGDVEVGIVFLLDGSDGSEIRRLRLGVPSDAFGIQIHRLSDMDGDGVAELGISAASYPVRGFRGGGRVSAHDGATGDLIWTRTGQDFHREAIGSFFGGDVFGATLANVGDTDGDGFDDVAAWSVRGIFSFDSSRVTLLSGLTGEFLSAYEREESDTHFGEVLSGLGDVDGDGRSEFLIGAPELHVYDIRAPNGVAAYDAGRVYAVSYLPEGRAFIRTDADLDGDTDVTDAIVVLEHLFRGKPGACEDAMDADRSLRVDTTDAAVILLYLFGSGYAPEPPFPDCGRLHAFRPALPCERSSCP